jgi:hypothetical protein
VEFGAPGKGLIWDSQYNVKQSETRSEFLFEITIPTDASGTQKLFGYAIDSNGNEGPIVEIGSVEVTEPFESIFTVESDGSVLEADFAQGETVNLRYLVEDGSLDASRYSQTVTLNGVSSTFRYTDATETSRTSTNDLLSTYWSTSFDIPLGAEPGFYEVSVRVTNGSGKSYSARLAEIRVTEAIDDPLVFNPQPELFPWLSDRQIFSDVNIFQGPVTINFNGSQSTSNVLTDFSRSSLQIKSGPTSFLLRGPEGAVMNSNSPSVIESGTSLFTQISGLTPNASLATYLIPAGKSSQSYTPSVIARSNALGQVSFDNQIQAAPGDYNLEIVSSDTSIPTQVVPLSVRASSYGEMSGWTVNQGDGTAKVYVKFPTVGEKVRIGHQKGGSGSYETIYVKTTDSETMDGLKIVPGVGTYIVRTIDLVRGTNRIKVTVGDNREVQVRYNR